MRSSASHTQPLAASLALLPPASYARFAYKQAAHFRLAPDEREDCAASFRLHILQHSPSPDAAYTPTFLNRCAANFVSNYCRSRARLQCHETAYPQQTDADGDTTERDFAALLPASAARLIQQEARDRICTVMQSLTPRQCDSILRYYLHDESYAEIAEQTGLTPDAVRMCITRGLHRLRTLLNEQGMNEAEACEYLTEIVSLNENRGG